MTNLRPYEPCSIGIHVCGVDEVANCFFTQANFPVRTIERARDLFAQIKDRFSSEGGRDFVVDLNIGTNDHQVEDFGIRRQMLEPMARFLAEATLHGIGG